MKKPSTLEEGPNKLKIFLQSFKNLNNYKY